MRFGIIDLETKGLGGDIVIVGVYDGERCNLFPTLEKAIDYIRNHLWCRTWYAHNGGGYDYRYFLDSPNILRLIDRGSMLMINGRLASFRFKDGVAFKDSFCLLPQSLNALAKGFGFKPKLDYDDYEEHKDKKKLYAYVKYDCELLHAVIQEFKRQIPAEPRLTLASTALAIWRGMYPKLWKWLRQHKLTKAAREFAREGYYGGRVEVFRQMGAGLCYYDVNSMYPAVMLDPVPWGYWEWVGKSFAGGAWARNLPGLYMANVLVPPMNIPPLPIKRGGKLIFPIGRLTGVWTQIELAYAVSIGCKVKKIHRALVFKETKSIFSDYVDRFWKMKAEGTGAKRTIAKLLLNSCYGKFGQRCEYTSICGPKEAMNRIRAGESIEVFDRELGLYLVEEISTRDFIRPEIAAYITARARVRLHKAIRFLELRDFNVYYCDTDSIVVDGEIKNCLRDEFRVGRKLGQWKLEKKITEGVFLAPKTYVLLFADGRIETALKGIPAESATDMTIHDVRALISGRRKSLTMKVKRLVGLGEASRRIDTRRAQHRYRSLVERNRTIRVNVDKRRRGEEFKTHPKFYRDWS